MDSFQNDIGVLHKEINNFFIQDKLDSIQLDVTVDSTEQKHEKFMDRQKKTNPIFVGNVGVGGDHPISVQSMTNTNTADIQSTVSQINELEAKWS